MFRYLGSILIVVMVLVLVVSLGVILLDRVAVRLSAEAVLRLTAFDGIGPAGGPPPRLRAWIEGVQPGRPPGYVWLVTRFEDGWSAWGWLNPHGLCRTLGPRDLTAGTYRVVVGPPEVCPRLDLVAAATVYVRPQDEAVIWFDAGAIVPAVGVPAAGVAAGRAAVDRPPEGVRDIVDVVKTLASGRLPVYLVSADASGYALARRCLKAYGAPPGPAFWVIPGKERSRLLGLKRVWPRVDAAVVCDPALRAAAAGVKVAVREAPSADVLAHPAETRRAWRGIRETLTAGQGGDGNVRR